MAEIQSRTLKVKENLELTVSCAEQQDEARILQFCEDVYTNSKFLISTPDEVLDSLKSEKNWIEARKMSKGDLLLKGEVDGKIVSVLTFKSDPRKRRAHIGEFIMFVKKDYRGLGIGSSILNVLIEWARSHSLIEKVCLSVFTSNERAILLYKKLGFEEEGVQKKDIKFEDGEYTDSLLMVKFVKSESY